MPALQCRKCGKWVDQLYFSDEKTLGWCGACRATSSDHKLYTGRKVWRGEEVYGKKIGTPEFAAETEERITRPRDWAEERLKKSGRNPFLPQEIGG